MVLQTVISFGYELVRESWLFSALVIKFVIAAAILKLAYEKRIGLGNLGRELVEYSRETLTFIVAAGLVMVLVNIETPLYLPLFSKLVALAYFGFLFWKY